MKKLIINSKRYGRLECLLDDSDYRLAKSYGNGNGKWCVSVRRGKPYVQKRCFGNTLIELHRLIMRFPKGKYIDHKNGNTLDNRKSNLRVCSNSANLRNGSLRNNNTSGATGVYWVKRDKKWGAKIKVMYKDIHLGRFKNLEEAIRARKQAELKYWDI